MARNTFFIADTHFGHANCLNFTIDDKGTLMRPGFSCVEDMDNHMVNQWNSVVRDNDLVYLVGDVAMTKKNLITLARLKGDLKLVKGNHDLAPEAEYLKYFKRILGSWNMKGTVLTHIPIHPQSLDRWGTNVHGHLHTNQVMASKFHPDPRYLCVSVEQIDYTPISIEEVRKIFKDRLGSDYEVNQ